MYFWYAVVIIVLVIFLIWKLKRNNLSIEQIDELKNNESDNESMEGAAVKFQNDISDFEEEMEKVKIETNKGTIDLVLNKTKMPITVNNFLKLTNNNFYDGLTFHRVEDWVIQGGDPNGNGTGGSDERIPLETHPTIKNIRGAIAMARTNDPNSATSQFYILKKDASWLDGQYAVFGNVVSGLEVVDNIVIGDKIISIRNF